MLGHDAVGVSIVASTYLTSDYPKCKVTQTFFFGAPVSESTFVITVVG